MAPTLAPNYMMSSDDLMSQITTMENEHRYKADESLTSKRKRDSAGNQQSYHEDTHHPMLTPAEPKLPVSCLYTGKKRKHYCTAVETTNIPSKRRDSFASLPDELIFCIISFVGPTSSTLLSLAQLSKYHSNLLNRMGDAMLIRAKSHFRVLLPPSHIRESSISLFVKHAQYCRGMRDKMRRLEKILEKNFVVDSCLLSSASEFDEDSLSLMSIHRRRRICISGGEVRLGDIINGQVEGKLITRGNENTIVTTFEVDLAIDLARSLLGSVSSVARHGNELGTSSSVMRGSQESSLRHVSAGLESQVLALCGKCGGKIFKYAKMRLWLRNVGVALASDRQDITSSIFVRELIVREGHKLRLAFLQSVAGPKNKDTTEQSLHSLMPHLEKSKDEERMCKARLIMKLVICRDLELSAKDIPE